MDLVILPILLPLVTAISALMAWRSVAAQQWIGVMGSALLLICTVGLFLNVQHSGIQAVNVGNWPAPFGITLVADLYSAVMLVAVSAAGLMVAIFSLGNIDRKRTRYGYFQFIHFMQMGVNGAFLTGDIFNLFVWFEVMLISSFVLIALGEKRIQLEGAVKYVTLNLVASALFLAGTGILYSQTGTLNFADLALRLTDANSPIDAHLLAVTSAFFILAFGLKAGVFPLFFWLPASYHTPPEAVSAIFSALLTKVGVYALIRYFSIVQPLPDSPFQTLFLWVAALTMVIGVLGAVAQYDMRRLLSFHIISQIGYAIMGLAIFSPLALAGTLFFLVHNISAKTNLFLVSGITYRIQQTHGLRSMGGLFKRYPGLSIAFMVSAFSLAGLPPLAGFFAKLVLIQAGIEGQFYWITAVSLAVGLLTLFSMCKILLEAFWKEKPSVAEDYPPATWSMGQRYCLYIPATLMAGSAIALGLFAEPCLAVSLQAAQQLLNPADYIQAVQHLES